MVRPIATLGSTTVSMLGTIRGAGLVLGCFFIALRAAGEQPGWTAIGPAGSVVRTVAVGPELPRTLYVGTEGQGVFRSSDDGITWVPANAGLGSLSVRVLSIARPLTLPPPPNYYLVAGTAAGVYWSFNFAETWVPLTQGLTDGVVQALATTTHPVVAGTASGAFRLLGDSTWTPSNTGLSTTDIRALAAATFTDLPILAGTVASAGQTGGIFVSRDAGQTWMSSSNGLPPPAPGRRGGIVALAIDPGTQLVYASVCEFTEQQHVSPGGCTVFRSADGGTSWSASNGGLPISVHAIAVDSRAPSVVYAGGFRGVYRSLDSGTTWLPTSPPLDADVRALTADPLAPAGVSTVYAVDAAGRLFRGSLPGGSACGTDPESLCLENRFRVGVVWRGPGGTASAGQPVPISGETGGFWFFENQNIELVVKALDGRSVNGKFWMFFGSLTNVEFTLTITDTTTGAVKIYTNPPGQLASVADTQAF